MTPGQKRLARNALGLPNDDRRSYRNRFHANRVGNEHARWLEMVTAGRAKHHTNPNGPLDFFWLTRTGAEAALEPGETLCPEDFPDIEEEAADV